MGAVKAGNGAIGYADESQARDLGQAKVKVGSSYVAPSPDGALKVLEASQRVTGQGGANAFPYKLNRTSTHKIQIGISIATGSVVAGCMGSLDRVNYTVLGDRVNLASRLCHQAASMEVLIDETTRARLGARAEVTSLPGMQLRGLTDSVHAYQLVAVKPAPTV